MGSLFFAFLLFCQPAIATLGEPWGASTRADAVALEAPQAPPVMVAGTATCHPLSSGRASICEYAEKDGPVYAVTWTGRAHPDIAQLMGPSNYQEYEAAKAQMPSHPHRRATAMRTRNLIVDLSSGPRYARGSVCMPALLPAGITCGDLP